MKRAIAAVFVLWSSVALAQPAGAQAEVWFRQGRDLLAAGHIAETCSARNLPRDVDKPAAAAAPLPLAPPSAVAPAVVPAVVPAIDRAPGSSRASHDVPIVLGASALALLGGGLGFELRAEARYDAAKSEMTSRPRRDSLYDSANTNRYIAEALAASGLVAGGVAVWLALRDGDHRPNATIDASLHVVPTATGLAVSGRF